MKVKETERLLLYVPDLERDLEAHAVMMADESVGRWLPKGTGYTREETEKLIGYFSNHWTQHSYGPWAVYNKETGMFIGHCGLNRIADLDRTEVLYAFTREARGNGYCTEAAKAALDLAFTEVGLETVIALAKPDNGPSIRVMEKLGMKYAGKLQFRNMDFVQFEIHHTSQ